MAELSRYIELVASLSGNDNEIMKNLQGELLKRQEVLMSNPVALDAVFNQLDLTKHSLGALHVLYDSLVDHQVAVLVPEPPVWFEAFPLILFVFLILHGNEALFCCRRSFVLLGWLPFLLFQVSLFHVFLWIRMWR